MRLIDADELLTDNTWEWFDEWGNRTPAGKAIMDAPTIDAEPVKHGEWIRIEIKGVINPLTGENRTYTGCSCCGEPIPTDSILDCIEEEEVNFCFGCGAKMKGQEE